MRATPRFIQEIKRSHTVYEYVDAISANNQTTRLNITVGTVTADRSGAFRRSLQVTCFDPTGQMVPSTAASLLTPFGSILRPYSGVRYSDGTTEVYPLGVFRIADVDIVESNPTSGSVLTMNITAYDLSRTIDRHKFTTTYVIAQGTLLTTAMRTIVNRTFPGAEYNMITHGATLPYGLSYAVGDSPWASLQALALSIGCECYFDVNGVFTVVPPADINALGSPVMDYTEGDDCTMTDITVVYTDSPGYNGVIVIGASPATGAAPVQGVAWDTNPASPTYYLGPYGQVPQVVTDTNITTQAAAQAAAVSLLNSQLGFVRALDVTGMGPGNPALDVDDVVYVKRTPVAQNGSNILDSVTIPLGQSQTGTPAGFNSQALTLRGLQTS